MTAEQIELIHKNRDHFNLVLNHRQNFPASHDVTRRVLDIYENLTGNTSDCCPECIKDAYAYVWQEFQISLEN